MFLVIIFFIAFNSGNYNSAVLQNSVRQHLYIGIYYQSGMKKHLSFDHLHQKKNVFLLLIQSKHVNNLL